MISSKSSNKNFAKSCFLQRTCELWLQKLKFAFQRFTFGIFRAWKNYSLITRQQRRAIFCGVTKQGTKKNGQNTTGKGSFRKSSSVVNPMLLTYPIISFIHASIDYLKLEKLKRPLIKNRALIISCF